ncbi:sugar ABC transporter permease [Clostridium sp. TM06-18]|jgi:putative aldouronate transport system permease protein|nr:ABC transporter permease subunit [Clostridium sp. TM06-18]RHU39645.1 sugar ABC transporter permease [Clostridium sp. TM06-18]
MKEKPKKKKLDQGKRMFLYMLPFLLLCFAFSYFPLHGWIYSFYDYKPPLKLSQCNFMGLRWFKMIFGNPAQVRQLFIVMRNTFAMSFLNIATSVLPLFFAVFLNEIKCKWFRKMVQTLTTIPNFISWVLVYAVAFCLFSNTGMVNTVFQNLGVILKPIKFLDSDSHTYIAMLLWSTWKGLGWGAIMYLASIAGIDQEMYEAARVDGAGRFQLMRYITLPELMPTYFVMLMLSVANFLNNGMDQYFVFQNAFNKAHIQVLDLYVYNIGMTGSSLSLATAISMLKSLISVTLLMAVNGISKKIRGVSLV